MLDNEQNSASYINKEMVRIYVSIAKRDPDIEEERSLDWEEYTGD